MNNITIKNPNAIDLLKLWDIKNERPLEIAEVRAINCWGDEICVSGRITAVVLAKFTPLEATIQIEDLELKGVEILRCSENLTIHQTAQTHFLREFNQVNIVQISILNSGTTSHLSVKFPIETSSEQNDIEYLNNPNCFLGG